MDRSYKTKGILEETNASRVVNVAKEFNQVVLKQLPKVSVVANMSLG